MLTDKESLDIRIHASTRSMISRRALNVDSDYNYAVRKANEQYDAGLIQNSERISRIEAAMQLHIEAHRALIAELEAANNVAIAALRSNNKNEDGASNE